MCESIKTIKKRLTQHSIVQDKLITSVAEGINNGGVSKDGGSSVNDVNTSGIQSSHQVGLVCIVVSSQDHGVSTLDRNVYSRGVNLRELNEVGLGSNKAEEGKENQETGRLHDGV